MGINYKAINKTGGYIPTQIRNREWEIEPRGAGLDVSASSYVLLTWNDIEQLYKIRCEYLAALADGAVTEW